jgi:antitoxin YefM
MNATTHTDLRKNLKEKLDQVHDDNETLIVKRKNDKDVVIISLAEYNSLIETDHLLSSPANVKQLLKAIEDVEKGENLIDVEIDD